MKNKQRKLLSIVLMIIAVVSISLNTYAHSGRTDSSGGHKDNQNKSGLGSYHYHCGGHPAHLHPNGVCPYATTGAKQIQAQKQIQIAIRKQMQKKLRKKIPRL